MSVHKPQYLRTIVVCLACIQALGVITLAGCSPQEQQQIVATIGTQPLNLAEYEQQYAKSLGSRDAGAATSQDDREKFLDLIVKYRLKLASAYKEGLDKKPEVLNEIAAYKGSLAASYLTEREVVAPGIRRLYLRRNEEIRASHILISLALKASPAESIAAYKKAEEIITALKTGIDFGKLALQYSQDPSVKQNSGDLYYFTAGQLVAPFEDAAFAMKPGETSAVPVRTQYGLHIIKITDRKIAPGDLHAGHIMIRFQNQNPSPDDTAQAYGKIKALKDSLDAGVNFALLAQRHSEDPGSSGRGGDLGYFSRRRWVQPFDEVAMALQPGQVSGIVRTPYGYHLIKCYDMRPRKSFEEAKSELQQIYQQLRFQDDYAKFIDGLRKEVHFLRNDSTLTQFLGSLDTTRTTRDSAWWSTVSARVDNMSLFIVQGQHVTVDSVIELIKARTDLAGTTLRSQGFSPAVDKIGEQLVFSAKADLLAKKDPEFAALLTEYREGILLYQVEQENVWNRVVLGDSVLRPYFASNREKFAWPERISLTEVKATSDSLAGVVSRLIISGKSVQEIAADDSIHMLAPTDYRAGFAKGQAKLDMKTKKSLEAMAREMKQDARIRINVTARPDTATEKSGHLKLAAARVEAVRSYLVKKLAVNPNLISTATVPLSLKGVAQGKGVSPEQSEIIEISIVGRVPLLAGKPETMLVPLGTDELAQRADSLLIGSCSKPFFYKGYYTVVLLNEREKARQKTYDEAGPELSSAYQDYESKRLENEWLERLQSEFPVVENKPVLKYAFAQPH